MSHEQPGHVTQPTRWRGYHPVLRECGCGCGCWCDDVKSATSFAACRNVSFDFADVVSRLFKVVCLIGRLCGCGCDGVLMPIFLLLR